MSTFLDILSFVLGALALACAASALPSMVRAFRAGVPIWYGGIGWYGGASRHMPDAARPHARRAMKRWIMAMGLMVLAAVAAMGGEASSGHTPAGSAAPTPTLPR